MSTDESLKDVVLVKYISNKQLLLSNSGISVKNIGRVIYLSTFTDGTNRLITDNNQLMSRQFMSRIMGLSDKPFREFLKEIKDCGVLIEDKVSKCFCLSDKYFVKRAILKKEKGMRYAFVSKCAVRHFYNSLGTHNHNVLSYLFCLVPFAHLQNNVICRDIESELNNLETLKLTEMARIIGVSDEQFLKNELLDSGVITKSESGYEVDKKLLWAQKDLSHCKKISTRYSRSCTGLEEWKDAVILRDKCCQCCGSTHNLQVHHILNYSNNKDVRTDMDNGITLCESCHSPFFKGSFHNIYGTRNNTKEQLEEYIKSNKYNRKLLQAIADGKITPEQICENYNL